MNTAKVILFKPNGKYYTTEEWQIPVTVLGQSPEHGSFERVVIGPFDMRHSPDFRRIDGGPVLVPEQEPWGYPHLFPAEPEAAPPRTQWHGRLCGGPEDGEVVTSRVPRVEVRVTTWLWLDEPGNAPREEMACGFYVWSDDLDVFEWEAA